MPGDKKVENYKETLERIQKLNPGQKIQLAQKGNPSERKILARNAPPDLLLALVGSPKITEPEIERIAANASTPEVVLKNIYSSARWKKGSRVRLACLKNPKLPAGVAKRLLTGFSKHQLRNLVKDPAIPVPTREALKRMLVKK